MIFAGLIDADNNHTDKNDEKNIQNDEKTHYDPV